jgi:hypothetical protein
MLVFAALWGHADKAGRFEWRPRTLKLDILPFLNFDLAHSMSLLVHAGFLRRYVHEDKQYGEVVNFEKHQRIGGKEAQEEAKHPEPSGYEQGSTGEAPVNTNGYVSVTANSSCSDINQGHPKGSTGEAPGKHLGLQEGKGREEEEEGKGNGTRAKRARPASGTVPPPTDVCPQVWNDWLAARKAKHLALTQTAVEENRAQATRAGLRFEDALRICCARGWGAFNADWDWRPKGNGAAAKEARAERIAKLIFGDRQGEGEVIDA